MQTRFGFQKFSLQSYSNMHERRITGLFATNVSIYPHNIIDTPTGHCIAGVCRCATVDSTRTSVRSSRRRFSTSHKLNLCPSASFGSVRYSSSRLFPSPLPFHITSPCLLPSTHLTSHLASSGLFVAALCGHGPKFGRLVGGSANLDTVGKLRRLFRATGGYTRSIMRQPPSAQFQPADWTSDHQQWSEQIQYRALGEVSQGDLESSRQLQGCAKHSWRR